MTPDPTLPAPDATPSGPYVLPALRFPPAALAPVIDEKTMRVHHGMHHQAYIDGLNAALAPYPQWQGLTIEDLLRRLEQVPAEIRQTVRNQGGGHANHQFFWKILTPAAREEPSGDLAQALKRDFGSVDGFRRQFEAAGTRHFGSGWVFLVANPADDFRLEIVALPNQDSVLGIGRLGLLTCDLWEHAYYLNYEHRRAQWLHAWWQVVDWAVVAQRLDRFRAGHRLA